MYDSVANMQNHHQYSVIYPPNRPMDEVIVQPNGPFIGGLNYFIDFNKKGNIYTNMRKS